MAVFQCLPKSIEVGEKQFETATVECASRCYTQYLRLCWLTEIINIVYEDQYSSMCQLTFIVSQLLFSVQTDSADQECINICILCGVSVRLCGL